MALAGKLRGLMRKDARMCRLNFQCVLCVFCRCVGLSFPWTVNRRTLGYAGPSRVFLSCHRCSQVTGQIGPLLCLDRIINFKSHSKKDLDDPNQNCVGDPGRLLTSQSARMQRVRKFHVGFSKWLLRFI